MTDKAIEQESEAPEQEELPIESGDEQAVTTEEEAATSDNGDDAAEEAPKKSKGVQKRIDELTAQRRSAEEERDYWRQMAMQQQQRQEPPKTEVESAKPEVDAKPNVDSFETYEEYIDALTDWKVEQSRKAEKEQAKREQADGQFRSQLKEHGARVEAFKADHPDFDMVAGVGNPSLPITKEMAEIIVASERGPEIQYALGQNPKEAARIASLPPVLAAREIGMMEARMSIPKPKTETKAPPPIEPVGGGQATAKPLSDISDINEWMVRRNRDIHGK